MMTAEPSRSGLRPALSTTNNDAILLTNCTPPTIIVAKCSSIVLPVETKTLLDVRNMRAAECRMFDVPDSRKISTVKNMIASIPLICCNTSNIRPMVNGISSGRVNITSRNLGTFSTFSGGLSITVTAIALSAADSWIDGVCSLSHLVDWSASRNRYLLRNQTGDSGSANITMHRENATVLHIQASVSHLATLPIMYALKIPNDIMIEGKDPSIPRIAGSQLSPI